MASGTIKAVVGRSDIVNNLTTNDSTKVLSAAQGKALSDQITNLLYETPAITISPNSYTEIDYPNGYTQYNTRIVSFVIANYYIDYKNISMELTASKIKILNSSSQTWANVKLLLYKV